MEQVGYDTYCKLLDEVIKEEQGIIDNNENVNDDVQIDINVSSYIPDEFIENSSQKIEIYQNIALCANEDDITNVIDEIIDRYGSVPKEIENLIEVTRIKYLAKEQGIVKISEKRDSVIFVYTNGRFNVDNVSDLVKKYGNKIKFSQGIEPYITLNIKKESDKQLLGEIKDYLYFILRKEESNASNIK